MNMRICKKKDPNGHFVCLVRIFVLFMIGLACVDGETAVNLLQKHDSCQAVRKGHTGHGNACICPFFDRVGKAVRAADDKHHAFSCLLILFEKVCHIFRGNLLSLNAHGNDKRSLRDSLEDTFGFLFKSGCDLSGRSVLRRFT